MTDTSLRPVRRQVDDSGTVPVVPGEIHAVTGDPTISTNSGACWSRAWTRLPSRGSAAACLVDVNDVRMDGPPSHRGRRERCVEFASYLVRIAGGIAPIEEAIERGAFGVITGDIKRSREIFGTLWDFLSMRKADWLSGSMTGKSEESRGCGRFLVPGPSSSRTGAAPPSRRKTLGEATTYPGTGANIPWFVALRPCDFLRSM